MTNAAGGIGTSHIGLKQAAGVFHATRYATETGHPLNIGVVINWSRLGIDPEQASRVFAELRRRVARRWAYLRKTGAPDLPPLCYVGIQENPDGRRNTHWNVSVPTAYQEDFKRSVINRLGKIVGCDPGDRVIAFVDINTPGTYAKYCLKGTLPVGGPHFYMRTVDQGFIGGRGRVLVSRTIGRTARKAAGWVRKRPKPPKS